MKNELSSQGNSFGQIEVIKLGEKLDGLLIKHKLFTAKVSLYGGQVLSWQPEGESRPGSDLRVKVPWRPR